MFIPVKNYLKKYFFVLGEKKRKFPIIIGCFILASMLDLLSIGLVGPFVASVISPTDVIGRFYLLGDLKQKYCPDNKDFVLALGVIIILAFYAKGVISYFVHKFIVKFSFGHQADMIKLLVSSYQSMDYEEVIEKNTSSLLNTVSGNVRVYVEMTLMSSLKLLSELFVFITVIYLLAITNISAMLLLGMLFVIVFVFYDKYAKKPFKLSGQMTALASESILRGIRECMGSIKEVKILNKRSFFFSRIGAAAEKYAEFGSKAQALQNIPRYLLESTVVSFVIVLAGYTVFSDFEPAQAMAVLGVFAVASVRLLPSVFQISVAFSNMRFSEHHLYELYDDLISLEKSHLKPKKEIFEDNYVDDGESFKSLKLECVSYQYPQSKKYAVSQLNFEIRKGECVGITGKSGSGKTTLIDIMLGLLTPKEGRVILNELPLSEHIDFWYKTVMYIPQTIFLIDDSIKNNIALGEVEIDNSRLESAIISSQLDTVVKNLPHGVDTCIGEDGVKLSGGQRQRVALARALYHQREVIILDEATSALDAETEKQVVDEINQLKGKKTLIVIAHRFETLKYCDRIVEIQDGRLIEKGNFSTYVHNA